MAFKEGVESLTDYTDRALGVAVNKMKIYAQILDFISISVCVSVCIGLSGWYMRI